MISCTIVVHDPRMCHLDPRSYLQSQHSKMCNVHLNLHKTCIKGCIHLCEKCQISHVSLSFYATDLNDPLGTSSNWIVCLFVHLCVRLFLSIIPSHFHIKRHTCLVFKVLMVIQSHASGVGGGQNLGLRYFGIFIFIRKLGGVYWNHPVRSSVCPSVLPLRNDVCITMLNHG